eukprot:9475256-Pyramimonas_sp.AAC.1
MTVGSACTTRQWDGWTVHPGWYSQRVLIHKVPPFPPVSSACAPQSCFDRSYHEIWLLRKLASKLHHVPCG